MSTQQQSGFRNLALIVFLATNVFAAGGAWYRLDSLARAQENGSLQRDRMQESIYRMQEQMNNLREQIQNLNQRLADKKLVADVLPRINVAGEAYKTTK